MVASVASSRSTISSVPIQPKSRAVTVASRYIPMFVGEVRWATTGAGSSWKLSGGSAWSAGVTKVSKKRQVRRAMSRSAVVSRSDSCSATDSRGGRLTQRATSGDRSQRPTNGVAIQAASGFATRTRTAATAASATPPAICR